MSKQHFLIQADTPLAGAQPGSAPERWMQAFPAGVAAAWPDLLKQIQPGDTVWIPAALADWPSKVRECLQRQPQARVAVVSAVLQDAEGLNAMQAGARAYCHQLALPIVLREVQQVLVGGGLWLGPELIQRLMAATRTALERSPNAPLLKVDLSVLSDRERQVAQAVAAGCSNKEVAQQLFISERTVKAHLSAVFDKLGIRDRVQLVLHMQAAQT